MTNEVYENMQKHDSFLCKYATKDEDVIYLKKTDKDIRTPFFKDIDKIIYSLSYLRYIQMGLTQDDAINRAKNGVKRYKYERDGISLHEYCKKHGLSYLNEVYKVRKAL